jgi:pyrroloquinoline-quinone synthase
MTLSREIDGALVGRRLLAHPFYRRWEAGELGDGELAAYGAQYLHVERQLPITLSSALDGCDDDDARTYLGQNLDDELHHPRPHVELFESFLAAVDASPTPATPATAALVDLLATAPDRGTAYVVGVLAAYEVQAAEIARSKSDGLRAHYGLGDDDTAFWDVHAALEGTHAEWTLEAAGTLDHDEVLAGVGASRDAWWGFLDEREAAALVA